MERPRSAGGRGLAGLLNRLDRHGTAIGNRLLADRHRDVMAARAILLDRLKRMDA
jgi:DNA repair protein RecO (recombination protein O)